MWLFLLLDFFEKVKVIETTSFENIIQYKMWDIFYRLKIIMFRRFFVTKYLLNNKEGHLQNFNNKGTFKILTITAPSKFKILC